MPTGVAPRVLPLVRPLGEIWGVPAGILTIVDDCNIRRGWCAAPSIGMSCRRNKVARLNSIVAYTEDIPSKNISEEM